MESHLQYSGSVWMSDSKTAICTTMMSDRAALPLWWHPRLGFRARLEPRATSAPSSQFWVPIFLHLVDNESWAGSRTTKLWSLSGFSETLINATLHSQGCHSDSLCQW